MKKNVLTQGDIISNANEELIKLVNSELYIDSRVTELVANRTVIGVQCDCDDSITQCYAENAPTIDITTNNPFKNINIDLLSENQPLSTLHRLNQLQQGKAVFKPFDLSSSVIVLRSRDMQLNPIMRISSVLWKLDENYDSLCAFVIVDSGQNKKKSVLKYLLAEQYGVNFVDVSSASQRATEFRMSHVRYLPCGLIRPIVFSICGVKIIYSNKYVYAEINGETFLFSDWNASNTTVWEHIKTLGDEAIQKVKESIVFSLSMSNRIAPYGLDYGSHLTLDATREKTS